MNTRLWLALCGAIAAFMVCVGSLNADNLADTGATNDVSAVVNMANDLNLSEQATSNYWYGNLGWSVTYPYLSYYPYYYNGYYPYYDYGYGYGWY